MSTAKTTFLNNRTSLFLDTLRILSAFTVLYGHLFNQWNYPAFSHPYSVIDKFSHSSVVIFFVLSGYVIAYTTEANNRGAVKYGVARLSRLYSIMFPAIAVSAIVQLIIANTDTNLIAMLTKGDSWYKYLYTLFFSNEIWFHTDAPPVNAPLWSLSFEFWYYVVFGFFFFKKGNSLKSYLLPAVACLIAGPKILILMPIWLLGNFAYKKTIPFFNQKVRLFVIGLLLLLSLLVILYFPLLPFQAGTGRLRYASQFVTDTLLGVLIAFALCLLPKYGPKTIPSRFVSIFKKLSDMTFPIYVLHMPFILLWRAVIGIRLHNSLQMILAMICISVTCIFLGLLFEKSRFVWDKLFTIILNFRFTKKREIIAEIDKPVLFNNQL